MQQVNTKTYYLMAYEIEDEEQTVELNFYVSQPKKKNRQASTEIVEKSVPRLIGLNSYQTILEIKRKIISYYRQLFD